MPVRQKLYCNVCGKLFSPNDRSTRFCSRVCANKLGQPRTYSGVWMSYQRRQVLVLLRKHQGEDVPVELLAECLYDDTEPRAINATKHVVWRLISIVESYGMQISSVYRGTRYGGITATSHFRLDKDVVLPGEEIEEAAKEARRMTDERREGRWAEN